MTPEPIEVTHSLLDEVYDCLETIADLWDYEGNKRIVEQTEFLISCFESVRDKIAEELDKMEDVL